MVRPQHVIYARARRQREPWIKQAPECIEKDKNTTLKSMNRSMCFRVSSNKPRSLIDLCDVVVDLADEIDLDKGEKIESKPLVKEELKDIIQSSQVN